MLNWVFDLDKPLSWLLSLNRWPGLFKCTPSASEAGSPSQSTLNLTIYSCCIWGNTADDFLFLMDWRNWSVSVAGTQGTACSNQENHTHKEERVSWISRSCYNVKENKHKASSRGSSTTHRHVTGSCVLQKHECPHQYMHGCQISSTPFTLPLILWEKKATSPFSLEDLALVHAAVVKESLLRVNVKLAMD